MLKIKNFAAGSVNSLPEYTTFPAFRHDGFGATALGIPTKSAQVALAFEI